MKEWLTAAAAILAIAAASPFQVQGGVLDEIGAAFGVPKGLLLTMCERESGPREDRRQVLRPRLSHDAGAGAGACGMKFETARLVLGRGVTREEMRGIPFTAVLAARYLTERRWCGRWKRWETRVLCYRVGPNRTALLARVDEEGLLDPPKWWGTVKIFKRWRELHGKN